MLFTEVIKLVPGFRFCPTDEELVSYYLKRKVLGRLLPFEVIAEIELYKYEPWDLPEKSALPTRDLEWYFFIPRDRKYPNGSRTNRATVRGYWKSTGRDRSVFSNSRVVGTKKTLIYYNGRAPKGERTNWVMLEYRLNDVECQRIHAVENGYVLCRVYQKSGLGPKNGEQYGAPVEEGVFEDSPTVELDGCGSLKPQVIDGEPYNPKTFFGESCTVQGDSDCTSLGIDMIQQQLPFSGLEPRDLSVHFEKLYGNFQQESMQNFTCASGDVGKLVESVVAAPLTFEDEAEMLEQLLDECTDQLKSVDEYQNNPMFADDGCHLAGVHLPSDGDFLELNDLASVSDSEEGKTYVTDNEKNRIIGFKDYVDESQDPLVQAPLTNDVFGECKNLLLGNALFEEEQVMPGVMEMQFISSTISCDSQQQFLRNCMLGQFPPPVAGHNEGTGPAGSPQPIEPDDEIGLKTVNHLTAYVSEKDNFRGFLESDGNPELLLQEGGYFDAVTLFTDELFEESTNTNLEGCNDHGIPQVTMASSHWANGVVESLDDRVLKAKDDGDSFQSEAICLEPGRRSPSSLSLISRLMGSLPTLPASAAELSPKAYAPGGSLHFRATEIAMGSVSGTCTCVGESVPSSCVSCSMTEIEKKGRFVKSMPFVRHTNRSLSRWDKGLLILAVFGGLLAVFIGVLVVAGTFKGLRGVCKLILSSKT